METVASAFSGKVEIILRGYPALGEIPDFHDRVTNKPGITFAGRYEWPDDLQSLYQSVDVVWAGDFMDAGGNSDWLLPNRLYEGGWFACPAIAPVSSETGRWIADQGTGFSISEPIEKTVVDLISDLIRNPEPIYQARKALLALPDDRFIEPEGELRDLIEPLLVNSPKP